jgi:hypothetical protein
MEAKQIGAPSMWSTSGTKKELGLLDYRTIHQLHRANPPTVTRWRSRRWRPRRRASSMKKALLFILSVCAVGSAQTLPVTVVARQNYQSHYSYVVPAYYYSQASGSYGCYGNDYGVYCSGGERGWGYATGSHEIAYNVTGATFTLLLPDGRMAVVNCTSKYALRFDYINQRSCRMPLVNDIEADFKGNKAKLRWSVSIDGKETASETYQILAVMQAPRATGTSVAKQMQPPTPEEDVQVHTQPRVK